MSSTLATVERLKGQGKILDAEADQIRKIYVDATKFRSSGATTAEDKFEAKRSFQNAMLMQFGQPRSSEIFQMMHRMQQQISIQMQQQKHQQQQQLQQNSQPQLQQNSQPQLQQNSQPQLQQNSQPQLQLQLKSLPQLQQNSQAQLQQNSQAQLQQNSQAQLQQNSQAQLQQILQPQLQQNSQAQLQQNSQPQLQQNSQAQLQQNSQAQLQQNSQPQLQQNSQAQLQQKLQPQLQQQHLQQFNYQQPQQQSHMQNAFSYPNNLSNQQHQQTAQQSYSKSFYPLQHQQNQNILQPGAQVYHLPPPHQAPLLRGTDLQGTGQYPLLPQLSNNSYNTGLSSSSSHQYQGQMYLSNDIPGVIGGGMMNNNSNSGTHVNSSFSTHQQNSAQQLQVQSQSQSQQLLQKQSVAQPQLLNYSIHDLQQGQYQQRQSPAVWAPSPFNGDTTSGMQGPGGSKVHDTGSVMSQAGIALPSFSIPDNRNTLYNSAMNNSGQDLLQLNSDLKAGNKLADKKPRKARPMKKKGDEGTFGPGSGASGAMLSSGSGTWSGEVVTLEGFQQGSSTGIGASIGARDVSGASTADWTSLGQGTVEETKIKVKRKYVRPAKSKVESVGSNDSLNPFGDNVHGGDQPGMGLDGSGSLSVVGEIKEEKGLEKDGEGNDEMEDIDALSAKRKRESIGRGSRGGKGRTTGRGSRALTSSPSASKRVRSDSPTRDGSNSTGDGSSFIKEEDINDQLERPSMEGMQLVDNTLAAEVVPMDLLGVEERSAKLKMRASLKGIKRPASLSARIGAAVSGGLGGLDDKLKKAIALKLSDKADVVEEDAIIAGVEFSYPHNIVDSFILEPLRLLSETSGISVGADVLEYISYGLQMHFTNILEACMKNSKKRRNVAGIQIYTSLHDKIIVKGERPNPKNTLGILWGPHVSLLLNDEEKNAKEELKVKEAEERESIIREMKGYDEEKRAFQLSGNKRGRGALSDAVETPWWIKEDAAEKAGLLDWSDLAKAQLRQTVAKEHNLGSFALSRRGGRAATVKVAPIQPVIVHPSDAGANNNANIVGDLHVRLERVDSLDDSSNNITKLVEDKDTITMSVTDEGLHSSLASLPSSPTSFARALKDALQVTFQANRALALNVGLVGAGMTDTISREDILCVLSHSAIPRGGGPRSALLGLSFQRAKWNI